MKKVVYIAENASHIRLFESFCNRDGFKQVILAPSGSESRSIKIEEFYIFDCDKALARLIKRIKPDIAFVSAFSATNHHFRAKKFGAKTIGLAHGVYSCGLKLPSKQIFDLYCFAGLHTERKMIKDAGNLNDKNLFFGGLPQFDLIYNKNYYLKTQKKVLNQFSLSGVHPDFIILFAGMTVKGNAGGINHIKEYYDILFELNVFAEKYNAGIIVRPKNSERSNMFLKQHKLRPDCSWILGMIDKYKALKFNKRFIFITEDAQPIYKYFFSDVIICNGISSVEFEACLANIPLIIVDTTADEKNEKYFGIKEAKAACMVTDIKKLEVAIKQTHTADRQYVSSNQQDYIKNCGVVFDGKAAERIFDFAVNNV